MLRGPEISWEKMIEFLNEDLAGEYQAIIAYTVYSQMLKGPRLHGDVRGNWNCMRPRNCSTR